MPTTQTTGMTALSAKKVSFHPTFPEFVGAKFAVLVWVGPSVVKELKRIVESSEITKYALLLSTLVSGFYNSIATQEDDMNWPKKNIVEK